MQENDDLNSTITADGTSSVGGSQVAQNTGKEHRSQSWAEDNQIWQVYMNYTGNDRKYELYKLSSKLSRSLVSMQGRYSFLKTVRMTAELAVSEGISLSSLYHHELWHDYVDVMDCEFQLKNIVSMKGSKLVAVERKSNRDAMYQELHRIHALKHFLVMAGIHENYTPSGYIKLPIATRSSMRVAKKHEQSSRRESATPSDATESSDSATTDSVRKADVSPTPKRSAANLSSVRTTAPTSSQTTSNSTFKTTFSNTGVKTTSPTTVSGKFSLAEDQTIWRELTQQSAQPCTSNPTAMTDKTRREAVAKVAAALSRATYMVSCRLAVLEYAAQEASNTAPNTVDQSMWNYYITTTPYNYSLYTSAISEQNLLRIVNYHKYYSMEDVKTRVERARQVQWHALFSNSGSNTATPPHTAMDSRDLAQPAGNEKLTPASSTLHQPLPSPQVKPPPAASAALPPQLTQLHTQQLHQAARGEQQAQHPSLLPHPTVDQPTIQTIPLPQPIPIPLQQPITIPTQPATYTFSLQSEAEMCCVALRYRHSQHILLPRYLSRLFKTMDCTYVQFKDHLNYLSLLMMGKRDVLHSDRRPFTAAEDELIRGLLKNNTNTKCANIGTLTPLPLHLILAANGHTKQPTEQDFSRLTKIMKCSIANITARYKQLRTLAVLHEVSRQEEEKASEVSEYRIGCTEDSTHSSTSKKTTNNTNHSTNNTRYSTELPYTAEAYVVRQARRAVSTICNATDTTTAASHAHSGISGISDVSGVGTKRARDDSSTDTATISRNTTQACANLSDVFIQGLSCEDGQLSLQESNHNSCGNSSGNRGGNSSSSDSSGDKHISNIVGAVTSAGGESSTCSNFEDTEGRDEETSEE